MQTDLANINEIGFMACPLMEVTDPELKEHTAEILKHANTAKAHMFAIAIHLLIIKDKELYVKDGFDGIGDYALKVLGYKPVTTSNMISVARKYLTPSEDGEYKSILARENGEDYTLNQLLEVKVLGEQTVIDMDKAGEIAPSMSIRQLRKVVKEHKERGKETGDSKPRKKRDKISEVERSAKPVTDLDLCITRVLESIPVIMGSARYKDDVRLCDIATTLLQLLQESLEDEEV